MIKIQAGWTKGRQTGLGEPDTENGIWLHPDMYSFLTSFKNGRDLVKIVKGKLGKIGLILENTSKRGQMGNSVKKKKKKSKKYQNRTREILPCSSYWEDRFLLG